MKIPMVRMYRQQDPAEERFLVDTRPLDADLVSRIAHFMEKDPAEVVDMVLAGRTVWTMHNRYLLVRD